MARLTGRVAGGPRAPLVAPSFAAGTGLRWSRCLRQRGDPVPGGHDRWCPAGFQNSAMSLDLVFYAARSYSLMRPARPRMGRRWVRCGEVSGGVTGPGRVQLAAAVGALAVGVLGVLGED